MKNYVIFDSRGKSLKFRGVLAASIRSRLLQTDRGSVWFELSAYQCDSDRWIVTITQRQEADAVDEVIEFYDASSIVSAEDFLFDFDPASVLPHGVLAAPDNAHNSSLLMAIDHVFYSAALRLVRSLTDHEREHGNHHGPRSSRESLTTWDPIAPAKQEPVINRIKHWFGM